MQAQGKLDEAEPFYQRTLTILEKSLGPEHPNVASTLNNLAQLLHGQGKSKDALVLMERVQRIRLAVYGPKRNLCTLSGACKFLPHPRAHIRPMPMALHDIAGRNSPCRRSRRW